jgi:hypothetical protein
MLLQLQTSPKCVRHHLQNSDLAKAAKSLIQTSMATSRFVQNAPDS